MQIKDRQKLLIILAATAVGLLLGDRFVFTPLINSWKERSVKIAGLKKSISDGTTLLQREQPVRERWDQMRTNTLPANVSVAESRMLNAFDKWARDSRVAVTAIKPQWKPTDENYMTFECQAEAMGSMEALARFLYEIDKDPLGLKFKAMEISTRDASGQQLSLTLQLSALLLKQSEL